jgi:hypothetical protein
MEDSGIFKVLKLVDPPESFELNERRAKKTEKASEWFPQDALYSASKELDGKEPAKALMVAWYEMDGDTQRFRYRLYCENPNDGTALGADIFRALTDHE